MGSRIYHFNNLRSQEDPLQSRHKIFTFLKLLVNADQSHVKKVGCQVSGVVGNIPIINQIEILQN